MLNRIPIRFRVFVFLLPLAFAFHVLAQSPPVRTDEQDATANWAS